ncbi:hypothetical protein BDZ45DRAFT_676422 [Acephala macrosclerotiorum]|nr:hypothetical protein BDZ45DRAFT_676422 [Acephala macrosclerotiorum]
MGLSVPHVLVALVLLSCAVVFIRRRFAQKKLASSMAPQRPEYREEKMRFMSPDTEYEYQAPRSMMPRPPPAAPFTPPTLAETNETNVRNLESVPASPISISSSSSPPSPSFSNSFDSFESGLKIDIPRRRSYTKTIGSSKEGEGIGMEVTGEIVVSPEGWRRHTRVFGGGVCKACEESERRMSA